MAKKLEKAQMGKIIKAVSKAVTKAKPVPRSVGKAGSLNGESTWADARSRKWQNQAKKDTRAFNIGVPAVIGGVSAGAAASGWYGGKKPASDTTSTKKKMGGAFDKYKSKKK